MNRANRRTALGWAATLAITASGTAVTAAASAPAALPANFQPTPAFTAAWQKAKASFAQCHYASATSRYNAIESSGVRLENPVLRYKFLEGVATALYYAPNKPNNIRAAKRYAHTAEGIWRQMTLDQQGEVQREAGHIEDITVGQFIYGCSSHSDRSPARRRTTLARSGRIAVRAPSATSAASPLTCHITATQGYSKVIGTVKATGLNCVAPKLAITSLDRAPIKGRQGVFSRRASGQSWRCSWSRTSDSTIGYKCSAGAKKLAWNFGQP